MTTAAQFLPNRLHALTGYLTTPSTFDAMVFYLPKFSVTAHRFVQIRDRLWELWSPNSREHAYYPGIRNDTLSLGSDLPMELRRSDGHLGRFDYTVSPQHFDDQKPWLGFIRKWSSDTRAENAQFFNVWVPSSSMPLYGHFKTSYVNALIQRIRKLLRASFEYAEIAQVNEELWSNRPQHLANDPSTDLEQLLRLDAAIDLLASVQRDVKELSAWNRMADTILRKIAPTGYDIPLADDSLLGVWINGCDEINGLWLLQHRVPCYIVHEGDSETDWQRSGSMVLQCINMTARTYLERLEPEIRKFEKRLVSIGLVLKSLDSDIGIGSYCNLKDSTLANRVMATPQGQGMIDGRYEDPRTQDKEGIAPLQSVFQEVEGKIIPPDVVSFPQKGSWSHWIQDTLDDGTVCMRRRSSHFRGHRGNYTSFDRHQKRILYTDDPLSVPRHYDANPSVFGLPGPNFPYIETQNEKDLVNYSPSQWCYLSMSPLRTEIGTRYVDSVEDRPRLSPPPSTALHEVGDDTDIVSLGGSDEEEIAWQAAYGSVDLNIGDTTMDSQSPQIAPIVEASNNSLVRVQDSNRNDRPSTNSDSLTLRGPERGPERPSLLARMSTLTSSPVLLGPPPPYSSHSSELIPAGRIPGRVMDMFPVLQQSPVSVMPQISQGSQTRFLLLWNVPVIYTWDNIMSWVLETVRLCYGAQLTKVQRSNEGGHQVFWLTFASEHDAVTFRGVVADRWTRNGHLVKCDFVSRDEYNSIGGRCVDKWEKRRGFIGTFDPKDTFPTDARPRLSHPSLAARLGVRNVPAAPTKRGRRGGSKRNKQSSDGGAL